MDNNKKDFEHKVTVILTCAGRGERAGFMKNKLLVPFNGKTCLERTAEVFASHREVDEMIFTSSAEDFDAVSSIVSRFPNASVVIGGASRSASVKNALNKVKSDVVLIHDGARPFVTEKIISDCIASVINFGSGIAAIPSPDTVCRTDGEYVEDYLGKDDLYRIQTPQGFFTEEIKEAYAKAGDAVFNDDGGVYKKYVKAPRLFLSSDKNVKLTYRDDFELLRGEKEYRFGVGFDCHRFAEGRKCIIGGVDIPFNKGLLGHSDADVLTHAIMDAVLSACALRDIGYYFPDTDPRYEGADSIELLKKVARLADDCGYKITSLSAVVMAEKPKLMKYIPDMKTVLASATGVSADDIGISATTLEGLGFVGREEGVCAHATATVRRK